MQTGAVAIVLPPCRAQIIKYLTDYSKINNTRNVVEYGYLDCPRWFFFPQERGIARQPEPPYDVIIADLLGG